MAFESPGYGFTLADTVRNDPELAIYRIVQEAVTNVLRHSHASVVELDIGIRDGVFEITIRDDGVGFDGDAPDMRFGFGLMSMQERALFVGGTLEISSSPDAGTRVTLSIPVDSSGVT